MEHFPVRTVRFPRDPQEDVTARKPLEIIGKPELVRVVMPRFEEVREVRHEGNGTESDDFLGNIERAVRARLWVRGVGARNVDLEFLHGVRHTLRHQKR